MEDIILVAGDLNGHVGAAKNGYRCHGGFGYGTRNDDGERILEYADYHDLVIVNTKFRKCPSHLVSFYSGNAQTQIDFVLLRYRDQKLVTDAKIVPYETVATQHRPLNCAMEVMPPKRTHDERCGPARINAQEETSAPRIPDKTDDNWRQYLLAKEAAKKIVAATKAAHYDNISKQLDAKDGGERLIYRLAKSRQRQIEDVENFYGVNGGQLITDRKKATNSTEEFSHPPIPQLPPTCGPIQPITVKETIAALERMKLGKATGPDDVAAELWKSRHWNSAQWLTAFFNKVIEEKKTPVDWQRSTLIPIWKRTGNPADCASYRPISAISQHEDIRTHCP
ncbi:hypothetical protein Y032_0034g2906 [Ancylostoma ceylanicum]|uniref:Endonuclease/exonuclease/phosphatase domain-containing protein n=1 Tax=Ancylostoma ceylanicum TaxID=53326 RepID=A0A016UN43_9BILA|nr:hypothetical protein Y032_0034g2906 [Ancylostoma ceylanicum]